MTSPHGIVLVTELPALRFAEADASTLVDGGWAQIAKTGSWSSARYGRVTLTTRDLQRMADNFRKITPKTGGRIPWDWDHLSDDPQQPGDGAAAGWITDVETRDGGNTLWARSWWTRRAAQQIRDGEYAYASPYFITDYVDKNTGARIGPTLRAAALTNRPFLEGMKEISIAARDTVVVNAIKAGGPEMPANTYTKPGSAFDLARERQQARMRRFNELALAESGALPESPGDADGVQHLQRRGATKPLAANGDVTACAMCNGPVDGAGKFAGTVTGAHALSCPHCGAAPLGYLGDASVAAGELDSRDACGAPVALREIQLRMLRERRQRDERPVI